MGDLQNAWFLIDNPTNMDDLGGSPVLGNQQMMKGTILRIMSNG